MDAVVYQIVEKAAASDVALEKAMSCHVWKAHSRSLLVLVSADSPSLLVLLSMVLVFCPQVWSLLLPLLGRQGPLRAVVSLALEVV